ncbi:MAG: DUF5686 family protein [Sediminibacterium sp.]
MPLRSCSVRAVNLRRGAVTDSAGYFSFVTENRIDSVRISMMGYQTITRAVTKKESQEINLGLQVLADVLNEVIVYPKGYDPAVHLFKKILRHKMQNNPDNISSIQYEVYDKLEFDANNISEKAAKSRLLKPFSFVFDHKDSGIHGGTHIPVFLTESIADYYYSKTPRQEKVKYKAKQVSGIRNESIIQYLDDLKQHVNIYENYPVFMKVTFISPLADNGLSYYKYAIEERKMIQGREYFRLSFHPLHSGSNTFTGECWVMDRTYAITAIDMHMGKGANINWVGDIILSQEFLPVADSAMMVSKNQLTIVFTTLSKKALGFVGKKTSYYRNIVINNPPVGTAFQSQENDGQVPALHKEKDFWVQHRFVPLTENEQWVYTMVDSIKKVPAFATYSRVLTGLGTGYYPVGKVDIGNIYKMFTANPIEGSRFNLGLRTNNKFCNWVQLKGYAGMGMKSRAWKYAVSGLFVLNRKRWETLQLSYQNDFATIADHINELNENSIFGSVMRRVGKGRIQLVNTEQLSLQYRKYYTNGFSVLLEVDKRILSPAFNTYYTHGKFMPIIIDAPGRRLKEYKVNEAVVAVRYAYKEKYFEGPFSRISLGSKYPVVELRYTRGIQVRDGFLQGDFSYSKYNVSVSHHFNINPFGKIIYTIEGGMVNGTMPILLLEVAKGNDTYYYNRHAFNNMNRYEFVSDHFAAISVEHQWGSFPFRHLPVIKKLNWRSVATFKALTGTMTDANKIANKFHDNSLAYHFLVPDKKPYMEAGYGIENIFRIIRVDAIWRLTYRDRPGIADFGLRASIQLKF